MAGPSEDDVQLELLLRHRSYTERFEFFVMGATLGILGLSVQLTNFKAATNVELISTAVGWILLIVSLIFAFLRAERLMVLYSAELRALQVEARKRKIEEAAIRGDIIKDPTTGEVWNEKMKEKHCEFFRARIDEAEDAKSSAHSRALGLYRWWRWTLLLGILSLMFGKLFEPIRLLMN